MSRGHGPLPGLKSGSTSIPGWSAAISRPARRSTSSRCGRPRRSTCRPSTASWAGPRAWASTAFASSCTTCSGSGIRRGFSSGWTSSWPSPTGTRSASCSCSSTPAGTRSLPGRQHAPRPGLHNSGWVQSPGLVILKNPERHDELEGYVKASSASSAMITNPRLGPVQRARQHESLQLRPARAREQARAGPGTSPEGARLGARGQPLAAADRRRLDGRLTVPGKLSAINRFMLDQSDVISFHNYKPLPEMKRDVEALKRYGRPILCTEYMARPAGQHVRPDPALPERREGRRLQLGLRGGQDADDLPVGLLAKALRRRAAGLVPRHLPPRRHAVRSEGSRLHPEDDRGRQMKPGEASPRRFGSTTCQRDQPTYCCCDHIYRPKAQAKTDRSFACGSGLWRVFAPGFVSGAIPGPASN